MGDRVKHDKASAKPTDTLATASDIPGPGDAMQEPVSQPVQPSSSASTGQERKITSCTDQDTYPPATTISSLALAGAISYPPEQEYREIPDQQFSDTEFSGDDYSNAEEGEV